MQEGDRVEIHAPDQLQGAHGEIVEVFDTTAHVGLGEGQASDHLDNTMWSVPLEYLRAQKES